ncbi:MAG: DUF1614 domain-containing protein [Candidatus Thorarchaeota archaeon]
MHLASEGDDEYIPIVFDEESDPRRRQPGRRTNSRLAILIFALMSVFLIQAAGVAFIQIGIPIWLAFLIVPGSLLGSLVNIPLYTVKAEASALMEAPYLSDWGFSFQVFQPDPPRETKISINLGGAVIPVIVSGYLILLNLLSIIPILFATTAVTIAVHRIARIEPSMGIVTPALLPPLAAVLATLAVGMIFPGIINLYAIAYISGTLGTIIGADFLNLGKLFQLKTDAASIGGAGTWDGVFLTGILAVVLL